jgi:BMFP domain-containing protein YqiC
VQNLSVIALGLFILVLLYFMSILENHIKDIIRNTELLAKERTKIMNLEVRIRALEASSAEGVYVADRNQAGEPKN